MSLRPESIPVVPEETVRARPCRFSERKFIFKDGVEGGKEQKATLRG